MNEYKKLLAMIKDFLNRPIVEMTEDTINAYDLLVLVNNSLEDLRSIEGKNNLKNKINKDNFLTSKIPFIYRKNRTKAKCYRIDFNTYKNNSEISFSFLMYDYDDAFLNNTRINILKGYNNNDIYFRNEDINDDDRSFVKKYYEEIMYTFSVLERFRNAMNYNTENFENEFLKGKIHFDRTDLGKVDYELNIKENYDINYICSKQFLDGESINDIIKIDAMELLKRIPVDVNELKSDYVKWVVREELNKNYIKVKHGKTWKIIKE